ncbi:GNAT family N-acetyltransferase [Enemella evansiae]|uniref:GNAT family N-acetyltransferase n=1 Tax=Enemella evansiae TaxID=2016499 RepID=UPI000B961A42|nr:GNAT family N-acetyltransferase [Enemella evansiae]OYO08142.1 GNAT family N-acetyltransferase [Enemella evansiae]
MTVAVTEIAPPLIDGAPNPELAEVIDLWRRWGEDRFGHDDFQHGMAGLAHRLTGTSRVARRMWVVREGERVVGSLQLDLPLGDNEHLADLEPCVDPSADPAAVLEALWQTVRPVLRSERRTAVSLWVSDPILTPDSAAETVTPSTGSGAVRLDATARWLLDTGFVLDQVERSGLLRIPEGLGDLDRLQAEAERASGDYELVQWSGPTPPELRDGLAVLRGRMSTDVPIGDLPRGAETWNAERVSELDEFHRKEKLDDLWTIAVRRGSGEPVAHTFLSVPQEKPGLAWQEDTLVRPDHRGHRLGLLVKTANLRRLRAEHPGVRRVWTWNADENTHMLAINDALGFRPDAIEGLWLLTLHAG